MPQKGNQINFDNADMRIFEVKPTIPKMPLKRPINPNIPRPPTSWFFVCGSGMGKSNLMTNLVFRKEYYADIFDKILYISPTVLKDNSTQPFLDESMEDIVTIRSDPQNMDKIIGDYIQYIDENFDSTDPDKPNPPVSLIIADDISGYMRRTSNLVHLTSRSRHFWCSLMISNQTLKDVPRVVRTLCKCIVLARCTNDMEVQCILDEFAGNFIGGRDMMLQVWREATKHKYNFLMIDMSVENDVKIRQIGSMGYFEFPGVSASQHHDNGGVTNAPMEEPDEIEIPYPDPRTQPDNLYCEDCRKEYKTDYTFQKHLHSKSHIRNQKRNNP